MAELLVRPLDVFPGEETKYRTSTNFKASWRSTLDLLDREVTMLRGRNVRLLMDVTDDDIRLDGTIRADARPRTPRVVLAFDSVHGPLKYGCDRFIEWRANVRAIALGLEALRKVERYGIASRGAQYTGWKQLPSGIAIGAAPMSREEAARILIAEGSPDGADRLSVEDFFCHPALTDEFFRRAAKRLHPDMPMGDEALFKRLHEAYELLRGE